MQYVCQVAAQYTWLPQVAAHFLLIRTPKKLFNLQSVSLSTTVFQSMCTLEIVFFLVLEQQRGGGGNPLNH